MDIDDEAEQAKLQEYTSRFQVGVRQWSLLQSRRNDSCLLRLKYWSVLIEFRQIFVNG